MKSLYSQANYHVFAKKIPDPVWKSIINTAYTTLSYYDRDVEEFDRKKKALLPVLETL